MKKSIMKVILTIVLLASYNYVTEAFEPVISSEVAINQLEDTYTSSASITAYENIKKYFWTGYIVIPVLVFFQEIKNLIRGD